MKSKAGSDRIFIRQLKIPVKIGIHESEREHFQEIALDLDFEYDSLRAANSDHIRDALDYAAITQRLLEYVSNSNFHLIEALAENIANLLFKEFSISALTVKIFKNPFDIKNARCVGLEIFRKNPSFH